MARIKVAMAYTSASTALNQKLSVYIYDVAPINEAESRAHLFAGVSSSFDLLMSFFNNNPMDQNMNITVKADARHDMKFTASATCAGSGEKMEKNAPNI